MAQYRQSGIVYGSRGHDLLSGASDHVSLGVRAAAPPHKPARHRRLARSDNTCRFSVGAILLVLSLALLITVLAYYYLSTDHKDINTYRSLDDDSKNDSDFLINVTRTDTNEVLNFGKGSVAHGQYSRYRDKDDRRRDESYNEDVIDHTSIGTDKGVTAGIQNSNKSSLQSNYKVSERGLYNEAGRNELKKYEAEYEASLKNVGNSISEYGNRNQVSHNDYSRMQNDDVDVEDEYDDGIDMNDARMEDYDETGHDLDNFIVKRLQNEDGGELSRLQGAKIKEQSSAEEDDKASLKSFEDFSLRSQDVHEENINSQHAVNEGRSPVKKQRSSPKGRSKRRKNLGNPCEMKLLNSTAQLVEPLESQKFARFSLQFTEWEEKPPGQENWEPRFSGHQSSQEREESFLAHDQKINCGFVKGPKGSPSTGFDLSEDDTKYVSRCHIAVISCIFGNSDRLRTPTGKTVTRLSRKNVCFVMFMDEVTLQTLSSEGYMPDTAGLIGLWKIVVVKNLPFTDMRRVGKVPKLLPHRIFPSARYSIWLDSKLRLQQDPLLILEYLLWRKGHEYAISNHYDRHCLWEEVAQNKKLNKYNHTVIDQQFEFYQADGLKRFNASDPKKLLPSNVPEGSFIARAHTPMSNLFSCLWFNEVDSFTPRDQLSFAYTYHKLIRMKPGIPFHLNMFKDCERRSIAKLFHHRSEEKRNSSIANV